MLLAIDSGNTNIVFAIFDNNGNLTHQWRVSSLKNRTADEFAILVNQLLGLSQINKNRIKETIIASVVPSTINSLLIMCQNYLNSDPINIGDPTINLGININTDNPLEVGADRLANAVAAHEIYSGTKIIIDFGTATTFDIINKQGSYDGGLIAPGIDLSLNILHQAAAQLPLIEIKKPKYVIGKNTVEAMTSGTFWGYVGLVEGLISKIKDELNDKEVTVISTGGLSSLFFSSCNLIEKSDKDLTLKGLFLVNKRNKCG